MTLTVVSAATGDSWLTPLASGDRLRITLSPDSAADNFESIEIYYSLSGENMILVYTGTAIAPGSSITVTPDYTIQYEYLERAVGSTVGVIIKTYRTVRPQPSGLISTISTTVRVKSSEPIKARTWYITYKNVTQVPFKVKADFIRADIPIAQQNQIQSISCYLCGENTLTRLKFLGSVSVGSNPSYYDMTFPYSVERSDIENNLGSIYNSHNPQIEFVFLSSSSEVLYTYYDHLWIRGLCTSEQYAPTNRSTVIPTYNIVNENTISYSVVETHSSSHPTSLAIGYSENGTMVVDDLIEVMSPYGNFSNLSDAAAAGVLSFTKESVAEGFASSAYTITFKKGGHYTLRYWFRYYYISGGEPSYNTTYWSSVTVDVYNKLTPKIEIVSATPTTWMSDDTGHERPLEGLNPFTVVVKDDTSSAVEYPIPQKSTHFNFGDNGKLTDDIDLENSSDAWVNVPNQTHVYTDDDTHTITLTITDKLGNVYEGKTTFTPSPMPRVVSRPEIKTGTSNWHIPIGAYETTGVMPDVVQSRAHIAGKPVPYVEWILENVSGTAHSSEYGVTKEGDFAEFALPKNTWFALHCDVYKDDTKAVRIGVRETFWLSVPANSTKYLLPAVADTSVWSNLIQQQDLTVWVLNPSKQRIDRITPNRIQYVQKYADADHVQFTVSKQYPNIAYLVPNSYIFVGYQGYARCMIVDEFNESDITVEIVAIDAASTALSARVATVSTTSTNGNGYDYQIAPAETLLQYFPISNILTGNRVNDEFVMLCSNQERGGKCVYSARYESIKDIVTEICADSGLGFDKVLYSENPLKFGMFVYAGRDLTSGSNRVVFSEKFKTAKIGNYRVFKAVNVAVTAGKGEGNTRSYTSYGQTTETGLARRETFVDAGDSADSTEQERMGNLELEKAKENSITVYPNLNNASCVFGTHYKVGDLVKIVTNSGLELDMRINTAAYSKDETGLTLTLECGNDLRGYQALIRDNKLQNAYARK